MGEVATSGDHKGHGGQSSLFLLRLWWPDGETPESQSMNEQESASARLHGRLLHVTGSGASNFESLPALVELLQQMLPHP